MKYSQSKELNHFLATLEKTSNSAVFLMLIENLPMLILAYGHKKSDELIASLCDKLSEYGEVHRIHNDQIALIIRKAGKSEALKLKKTIGNLARDYGVSAKDKRAAHISAIIDYCLITEKPKAPVKTLDKLYASTLKKSHISYELFDEEDSKSYKKSRTQMLLANQISEAVSDKRLALVYQPIIEASTGKILHYEALLRIKDKGELKSAGSFIPIAEKMGIIYRIDVQVLDMVIDKLKEDKNISLSFNISNLTIGNKQWLKKFSERVTPKIAERITVEITETAIMHDIRKAALFIATLQKSGCQVALDDFGSGYTSFRQIRALSLDYVKIDGSLVKDIGNNHHNKLLVKSLLDFLKGLGLKTVAEHVDSGETAKLLIKYGIDLMQGNYFGHPDKL